MQIAIDFDGTIVENEFPSIGKLKPNAKYIINMLHDTVGAKIIIWTTRSTKKDVDAVRAFLKDIGIKFDNINTSPHVPFANFPKIYADIYIDDRQAGGLPDDWEKIMGLIWPQIEHIQAHKAKNPIEGMTHSYKPKLP